MKQTGALIAAAGRGSGMDEFRPMLKLSGTTLIQKEIDTLRKIGAAPIVVVTGHEADRLEKHLSHRGITCIRNSDYETSEMLDSVKLGLAWLQGRCSQVLLLPVDAPLFSAAAGEAVMKASGDVVIPAHNGKQGHPIRIASKIIPRILSYSGENGLRGLFAEPDLDVRNVEVEDPGVLLEIDDRPGYDQALLYEKRSIASEKMQYKVRVTLEKDETFFGPGAAELLVKVDETGSLLSACKSMSMSYSKGWKMIKAVEDTLGFSLLERKAGGADGGNSRLTEQGRDFLDSFLAFQDDVQRSAAAFYQLHFKDKY